jgi:predicted nucleotide-binding protein
MPLTRIEEDTTKKVIATFLLSREATTRISLVREFEQPRVLQRLVNVHILRAYNNGQEFLPTLLAFHHCGDPSATNHARSAVQEAIRGLQSLFRSDWDCNRMYTPDELQQALAARKILAPADQVSLGLFLVRDFGGTILASCGTNPQQTAVTKFQISEDIVVVKDTRGLWDDYVRDNSGQIEGTTKPFRAEEIMSPKSDSRKVFVVHGHDGEVKQAVARFLERLDLQPIILHEQENRGRTIIEKFEANTDVVFAVVLLTPDDVGQDVQAKGEPNPRARQNVILELGFFLGKLGRANVCALYKGQVELPSDVDGVIYIPYDAHDGWKSKLAREIKAAGITLDLNKA